MLVVLVGAVGCGGGDATTVTQTVTAGDSASAEESAPSSSSTTVESDSAPKSQTFHGTGQKSLGTVVVPEYATVSWECASCGNTNFIIENSESDEAYFPVNALEETKGVLPVEAGTYHTVVVDTSAGPWTVTIEGE